MRKNNLISFHRRLVFVAALACFQQQSMAQAELEPWGNLSGIRVDGQLMEFETSIRVATSDWTEIKSTGKERQRPHYEREGERRIVTTSIDSLHFTEVVEDDKNNSAKLQLTVHSTESTDRNIYFSWRLPAEYGPQSSVAINDARSLPFHQVAGNLAKDSIGKIKSLHFTSDRQQLWIRFPEAVHVIVKADKADGHLQFYVPVHSGGLDAGDSTSLRVVLTASGKIDKRAVLVQINPGEEGRPFIGFGGNFRLQNPKADPQVIDYCLENMRVAFGRVEMPWRFWQPNESDNPIDSAKNNRLHPAVEKAMAMAQRLGKKGMPVILSAWFPPAWAVEGKVNFRPTSDGVWGNPLNQSKAAAIYKSIADYILYLRDGYGVEIGYFSFNESDLGINVRQTAAEHDVLIKGLGEYFRQVGLKTKMLLGDNSDATSYRFIDSAMSDPAARPYLGAVSFHSWRGWDRETLLKWKQAASRLNLPLIVAEGSIDAQAWGYPAIFEEASYAREEINLYIRLLSICQPAAILQWQLTSDYSPLSGGGIFGNNEHPLQPTQRFWNLKQLAATAEGLKAMGTRSSDSLVTVAALGDKTKKEYVLHLVNNGATRKVIVSGLPASIKKMKLVVTDKTRSMQEGKMVSLANGTGSFMLDAGTFTTLSSVN